MEYVDDSGLDIDDHEVSSNIRHKIEQFSLGNIPPPPGPGPPTTIAAWIHTRPLFSDTYLVAKNVKSLVRNVAAERLPYVLTEHETSFSTDVYFDKLFASHWINHELLLVGTKNNFLGLLVHPHTLLEPVRRPSSPLLIQLAKSRSEPPREPSGIHFFSVSPSGTAIATGASNPCDIAIMTYPDLVPLAVLEGCRDWVFDVIWLDDQTVVCASRDGTVKVWHLPSFSSFAASSGRSARTTCGQSTGRFRYCLRPTAPASNTSCGTPTTPSEPTSVTRLASPSPEDRVQPSTRTALLSSLAPVSPSRQLVHPSPWLPTLQQPPSPRTFATLMTPPASAVLWPPPEDAHPFLPITADPSTPLRPNSIPSPEWSRALREPYAGGPPSSIHDGESPNRSGDASGSPFLSRWLPLPPEQLPLLPNDERLHARPPALLALSMVLGPPDFSDSGRARVAGLGSAEHFAALADADASVAEAHSEAERVANSPAMRPRLLVPDEQDTTPPITQATSIRSASPTWSADSPILEPTAEVESGDSADVLAHDKDDNDEYRPFGCRNTAICQQPRIAYVAPWMDRCEHRGKVREIKRASKQMLFITMSNDRTAKVWNSASCSVVGTYALPHDDEYASMAHHESSDLFLIGSRHFITFLDPRISRPVAVLSTRCMSPPACRASCFGCHRVGDDLLYELLGSARSLACNQHVVAVGGGDGTLSFFDMRAERFEEVETARGGSGLHIVGRGSVVPSPLLQRLFGDDWIVPQSIFTLAWDPSFQQLFAGGGPYPVGLQGCYAALWA